MNTELAHIREEILDDHGLGEVDAAFWLAAHPEYAEEIRGFIQGLGYDPEAPDVPAADSLWSGVARRHLLRDPDAIGAWAENVGALIEEARAEARPPAPETAGNPVQASANAFTWTLGVAKRAAPTVTRLVIHKVLYFVEEAFQPGLVTKFNLGARGPFSPDLYLGESTAKARGWITVIGDPQVDLGPGGASAGAAESLAGRIPLRAAEALADFLSALGHDDLELLATVHWAAKSAITPGSTVGVAETKAAIAQTRTWEYKLKKAAYSDSGIRQALARLTELQLLPRGQIRLD